MGAAVAAMVARKQRDIVHVYRDAGATTAARARTPDDLGMDRDRIFDGLIDRAVIRESGDGRYYLDEPSWGALQRARRRLAVAVVLIVVIILTGLFMSNVFVAKTVAGK